MRRPIGSTLLVFAGISGGACTLPRSPVVHEGLDELPPAPVGRPVNPWVRPDDLAQGVSADGKGDPCGPRTGRNADGDCVSLQAEPWGLGERVLLPKGKVILGGVPRAYLGGPNKKGEPVIRIPEHILTKVPVDSFWMDVVEVQRADYEQCVRQGACSKALCDDGATGIPESFADEGAQVVAGLPQTCVRYAQAEAYCKFRSGALPTKAQWVYAARGPMARIYSWGPTPDDSISFGPLPVRLQRDIGYFGVIGLSGSVKELILGTPSVDAALAPWLERSFRSSQGPYARHFDTWTKRFACPKGALNGACRKKEQAARHLVSGVGMDDFRWFWDRPQQSSLPEHGPNGATQPYLPNLKVGFRCAYPRRDTDPELLLPKPTLNPPEYLSTPTLNLFVGVAEAVNYQEAKRFCGALRLNADKDRQDAGAWRLPTRTELSLVQEHRLGPGPLWTAEKKAYRAKLNDDGTVASWEQAPVDPAKGAILARCVR